LHSLCTVCLLVVNFAPIAQNTAVPKKAPTTVVLRNKSLYLVRRNGTGNWQINYKVSSLKTWQRKTAGTDDVDAAKIVAEDWVADIRAAERRGYPLVSKKFKAVADLVSAECAKHAKDGTGKKVYAQFPAIIERYLNKFFGKYNIDAINSSLISSFHEWRRNELGRELKQSTQNTHNIVLGKIFDKAVELGYMTDFQRPSLKNTGETGEARGFFTHPELLQLLEFLHKWVDATNVKKSRELRELLCLYVAFVACTGARPGTELKELRWKHFTFVQKPTMRVIEIYLPQGKKGPRRLIARNELWVVLEKLRALHDEFAGMTLDKLIESKSEHYVFRMRNGKRPYNFVNSFGDGIRKAGMLTNGRDSDERSLYSLRHYYATERLYENMSIEKLAEQMGTSPEMILQHYGHIRPRMYAEELAGGTEGLNGEVLKYMYPAQANMMSLLGAATGIYLPLPEQNEDATRELEAELLQQAKS
jgi:integrase